MLQYEKLEFIEGLRIMCGTIIKIIINSAAWSVLKSGTCIELYAV